MAYFHQYKIHTKYVSFLSGSLEKGITRYSLLYNNFRSMHAGNNEYIQTALYGFLLLWTIIQTERWSHSSHWYMTEIGNIHYNDVIMSAMASQITSLAIGYSSVYSGEGQRKHRSSASLAFVRGIQQWPLNSPHKGPVTRKMFPFDDVVMRKVYLYTLFNHKNMHSFIDYICNKDIDFDRNCSKHMSDMNCFFVYQISYLS